MRRPDSIEFAEYLRRRGCFHSMGRDCRILPTTNFTDPAYVRLGNNVHFSNAAIIGHDGSIAMLNQAYGVKLEAVGKIDIRDNVFIGSSHCPAERDDRAQCHCCRGLRGHERCGARRYRRWSAGASHRPGSRPGSEATDTDRFTAMVGADQAEKVGFRFRAGTGIGPAAGRLVLSGVIPAQDTRGAARGGVRKPRNRFSFCASTASNHRRSPASKTKRWITNSKPSE